MTAQTTTAPVAPADVICECTGSAIERDIHGAWMHTGSGCSTPEPDFEVMAGRIYDAFGDNDADATVAAALALAVAEGYAPADRAAKAAEYISSIVA